MKNVNSWLREHLLEANIEVDNQYKETLKRLESKKDFLDTLIDQVLTEKLSASTESFKSNKIALDLMLTDNALNSLANEISLQDISRMIYSETIVPNISKELEVCIEKELAFDIQVFPTGKPIPLYSFKSNSSKVYMFDILTEEEVITTIKNFDCKSFAGWCFANNNIIYTGGWKQGYASYEVFEINTAKWIVEPKPNLLIPRYQHSAIFVKNAVYVFGGATKNGITKTCEKWEINSGCWQRISDMEEGKTQMGICTVAGKIFLSGECEIEKYDPEMDRFVKIPIIFEVKLLSLLVAKENSFLIFRAGEVNEIECKNNYTSFKIAEIEAIDLWSTTQPVLKLNRVYFVTDNNRIVYSFDLQEKKLEVVTDLNHPEDSFQV
ncbi:hypothetical protein SteCoe_35146 [Stentor coeruleus]|uniref:BACK domain-containing protein n=1 Tax=Stentor coeruleus TaxID=5963 RepID=A0A1R2ATB2_9CILI|nr:hypothetical protein SteCoe_35146 [Stentor coeruleus]